MELRKGLELVSVEYENNDKKAVMTFLDAERKEVRIVNFNKQGYENGKYVDDPAKAEKVDGWCYDLLGTPFESLADCIGQKKDVYVYDRFNSLFEVQQVDKFTKDMVGCILQTEVKEIIVDDYFIKIRYDYEGKTYESKQTFGKYMESMKQWFVDPQKKEREYQKFEDKYGVPVSEKDSLIGHPLMVEVKAAFGAHYYGDIKKFPKTRK
jgi:hypothetical protein